MLVFSPIIGLGMLIKNVPVLIKIQIFDLKHRIIFFSEVALINFSFINIIGYI